jgi:replicative DNA helicase
MGIWISYPKAGKTTLLMNHGAVAMRLYGKRVFHAVLEGNLRYVEDRYDTLLSGEQYATVRKSDMTPERYASTFAQYRRLKGLCVVQDYTASWDCNVTHIQADLQDLERNHGWKPDLIIVDYLDLLKGRKPNYKSETESQKDAAQDLKKLANQGCAVWTASQVQRPRDAEDAQNAQGILYSSQIADCYAKVRIADFVGSINQTAQERAQKVMRLYAELYRDGPANLLMHVNADFATMTFGVGTQPAGGTPPHADRAAAAKPLGYTGLRQTRAGG